MEIKLITYNNENKIHLMVAKEILLDKEMIKTTGPLITNVLSSEDKAFLVELNNTIIGVIDFNYYFDSCYVSYGILKSQRGNKYSILLLNYIKEYILKNYPKAIDISLRIEQDNIASVKAALKSEYILTGDSYSRYLNYSFALLKINNRSHC